MFKNFDDLANWFITLNSHFSPSELHGALIGVLSGGSRLIGRDWQLFVFSVMGLEPSELPASDLEQHQTAISNFAGEQLEALTGNEMKFNPFLPDDDEDLSARTAALGSWCRGFLGGFAESQVQRQRIGLAIPSVYPEAVQEAIKDLTEIAKATYQVDPPTNAGIDDQEYLEEFDEDEDPLAISMENTPQDSELAESDYAQITEYVRLAGLTVFTEFGWVEVLEAEQNSKSKPSLH